MIYFLIVNYYSSNLIAKLIDSIPSFNKGISHQIIIINNSPNDKGIYQLQGEFILVIEASNNIGFGSACNLGLSWIYRQDPQAIIWLVNPDAYFTSVVLENIHLFFNTYPELSIVGTAIYTPSGDVWFAGGSFKCQTGTILQLDLLTDADTAYVICDWVSGCSLLINFCNFQECPQFDSNYFLYYEDFDFCQHYASLGHLIAVTKQFSVIHQPSTITNRNIFRKIQHSTYSYLITLEKYTNQLILQLRLTKLIVYALLLMVVKPQVAFGKLYGVFLYLKRSRPSCRINS